ncbi:MAG: TRAP transporter small permease [Lachnospiraceae bacterium]|nr:TRAP transporter small permease [Lachnospiraceae bacterium]
MKRTLGIKWILLNLEEILATAAITMMLLICSLNVFSRYVLRSAVSWADEVDICLLAWATFVGSAAAYKRNLHYGMDFLMDHLPKKGKRWLRISVTAIIGVTCAYLTYQSLFFTMKAVKVMPYSRLSYKWIDASAVAGFASMTVYSFFYLAEAFVKPELFKRRYEPEEDKEGKEEAV